MANGYDIGGLAAKLAGDIRSVVEGEVYDICENALRNELNRTVYSGGSTEYYTQTGELLRAVSITNEGRSGTSIEFTVEIDPAKVNTTINMPEQLNAHASVTGEDFVVGTIASLENGSSSIIHSHPQHGFYKSTYNILNGRLVGVMASALSAKGWDVSVG